MIIESISLTNFLSHVSTTVDFTESDMWLVCGDNGSGKSSLFDAVEYALYGQHRGGVQDADQLVKQGTGQGMVQVVIELGGARYRVTRHLHGTDGNKGGSIEEWNGGAAEWQRVVLAGGVRAAWEWLRPRLPDHALFRSAIFLRQNDAAFFLKKNANDRMRLFGQMIGLDQYTMLAEKAKRRADIARQNERDARTRLQALDDVSPETEQKLTDALAIATREAETARREHERAAGIQRDAREWARLADARTRLEGDRAAKEALIADEQDIRADHTFVTAWDQAAVHLSDYWRRVGDAGTMRQEAETQANLAEAARSRAATAALDLAARRAEHQRLTDEQAPALRARRDTQGRAIDALTLETGIARARAAESEAETEAERHAGKDRVLVEWSERKHALPYLNALAEARARLSSEQDRLAEAITSLTDAQRLAAEAADMLSTRQTEHIRARDAQADLSAIASDLDASLLALEVRLKGHRQLTGNERSCPTCDQTLTTDAHAHLRDVLAHEVARQVQMEQELDAARRATAEARQTLDRADSDLKSATAADQAAQSALTRATTAHEGRLVSVGEAGKQVDDARDAILVSCPVYADSIEVVSRQWMTEENARVESGLSTATREADALANAKTRLTTASAEARALRGHRESGAEPLGDTLSALDIERLAAAARAGLAEIEQNRLSLEAMAKQLADQIDELNRAHATAGSEASSALTAMQKAVSSANDLDEQAAGLKAELGEPWAAILTDAAIYITHQAEVARRRPSAGRIADLGAARGVLERIDADLNQNRAASDAIPPAHRLTDTAAHEIEAAAMAALQTAGGARSQVERDLADLSERREKAAGESEIINREHELAETFGILTDLLRDNGRIQNAVVGQEQRAIALEVNAVLRRLNDPMEVQVGDPRRANSTGVQDIRILDTTDPAAQPRHFEYLSGGEQFRVAMALALALHRRIGHAAGTLIIDEGFGALDSHRRDALAQQMTEQTQGILSLGLAKSIIICTHSTEVQRHFEHRWLVEKQDGAASVVRASLDTDGDGDAGRW